MTHPALFVYGTLRDPDIVAAVLGRPIDMATLRPATAPGYRAVPFPGQVYPGLIAAPDGTAIGLLLDNLADDDLAMLDAFEGDQYLRQVITVNVAGKPTAAHAYLPVTAIASTAADWTLEDWTKNHKPHVLATETATATATALRQRAG